MTTKFATTVCSYTAFARHVSYRLGMPFAVAAIVAITGVVRTHAQPLASVTCRGEFGTGSGMSGSYVGDACLLGADTNEETTVQQTCEQNVQCVVTGLAERKAGKWILRKIISASKADTIQDPSKAVRRSNQAAQEAETKERAKLDSMGSDGASVMRRSREIQEANQRAFEAALADAAKPANILLSTYRNYLIVRQCFDSRTGFAVVYLTESQLEEAKQQARDIETSLLQKEPGLDKDERWAEANKAEIAANESLEDLYYTGRGSVRTRAFSDKGQGFCGTAVGWLRETYGELYPDSKTVKKDF